MDLSKLKPSERIVEIVHPATGVELGVKITLVSISDAKNKKLKRKIADERYRLEAKGKHLKSEQIDENLFQLVFNSMTGWEWAGDLNFNGKKPDFNLKNVRDVCEELPWFFDQVVAAVGDEEAFFSS